MKRIIAFMLTMVAFNSSAFTGNLSPIKNTPNSPSGSFVLISKASTMTFKKLGLFDVEKPVAQASCGGILIGRKYVLTALHCVDSRQSAYIQYYTEEDASRMGHSISSISKDIKVFFTKNKSDIDLKFKGGYKVKKYYVPTVRDIEFASIIKDALSKKELNDFNIYQQQVVDIAILELEKDAPKNIPAFDISNSLNELDLNQGKMISYGVDTEKMVFGKHARSLIPVTSDDIKILGKSDLEVFFNAVYDYTNFDDYQKEQVSAYYSNSQRSSYLGVKSKENRFCEGDSGSPLFHYKENQYTLIGLVSRGIHDYETANDIECGKIEFYQTISPNYNWIKKIISK